MYKLQCTGALMLACAPVVLSGCGGEPASNVPPREPDIELVTELRYSRVGWGRDEVIVYPDGGIQMSTTSEDVSSGTTSTAQMDELLALLVDWPVLRVPPGEQVCADASQYSITYAEKTLSWSACTYSVPQELLDIAQLVWGLALDIRDDGGVGSTSCLGLSKAECFENLECEAIPYLGESLVPCNVDDRGFSDNCPFEGCRAAEPDCPSLDDLIDGCEDYCLYNSFAIDPATGCRTCECQ